MPALGYVGYTFALGMVGTVVRSLVKLAISTQHETVQAPISPQLNNVHAIN